MQDCSVSEAHPKPGGQFRLGPPYKQEEESLAAACRAGGARPILPFGGDHLQIVVRAMRSTASNAETSGTTQPKTGAPEGSAYRKNCAQCHVGDTVARGREAHPGDAVHIPRRHRPRFPMAAVRKVYAPLVLWIFWLDFSTPSD